MVPARRCEMNFQDAPTSGDDLTRGRTAQCLTSLVLGPASAEPSPDAGRRTGQKPTRGPYPPDIRPLLRRPALYRSSAAGLRVARRQSPPRGRVVSSPTRASRKPRYTAQRADRWGELRSSSRADAVQITRAVILFAASWTVRRSRRTSSLVAAGEYGTDTFTAATTPSDRARTGAAIDRSALASSSSLTARPLATQVVELHR